MSYTSRNLYNLMNMQYYTISYSKFQITVPFRIVRCVTGHRPRVTLSLASCDKVFDENSSLSMPDRNFSSPKFGQNHASHWPLPKQNFGAVVTGHRPCQTIRNGTVAFTSLPSLSNAKTDGQNIQCIT